MSDLYVVEKKIGDKWVNVFEYGKTFTWGAALCHYERLTFEKFNLPRVKKSRVKYRMVIVY